MSDSCFSVPFNTVKRTLTVLSASPSGKPILTQSGIPTRVLYDAYRLDEPLDVIAANYAITPEEVKQAVLYESRLQDAA
jgi:uncharacterized protein (DUF433 family)